MTRCQNVNPDSNGRTLATTPRALTTVTDGTSPLSASDEASDHRTDSQISHTTGRSEEFAPLLLIGGYPAFFHALVAGPSVVCGPIPISPPGRAGRGTWAAQRALLSRRGVRRSRRRAGDFSRTERKEIPMTAEREPCAFCGAEDWVEANFTAGRLVCASCWAGRKPAVAMPPTAAQKAAIKAWCAPRPPRQQTLNLGQAAQPQGSIRG